MEKRVQKGEGNYGYDTIDGERTLKYGSELKSLVVISNNVSLAWYI